MDDYGDFSAYDTEYAGNDWGSGGDSWNGGDMQWAGDTELDMPNFNVDDMWNNVPSGGTGSDFNFNGGIPQLSEQNPFPMTDTLPEGGGGWAQGGGSGSGGGIQQTLQSLFNNKGVMSGLGAIMEGLQNKKQGKAINSVVQQQQARQSPFDTAGGATAGSPRAMMQQQLSSALSDPYSAPIVKNQVEQISRAQAIKDAAAGRRSNSATTAPAMAAAQAQIAQQYLNSLYGPAGANISPSTAGLEQLIQGSKYDTQGFASPIMSAIGYNTGNNSNTAILEAIKSYLAGGK